MEENKNLKTTDDMLDDLYEEEIVGVSEEEGVTTEQAEVSEERQMDDINSNTVIDEEKKEEEEVPDEKTIRKKKIKKTLIFIKDIVVFAISIFMLDFAFHDDIAKNFSINKYIGFQLHNDVYDAAKKMEKMDSNELNDYINSLEYVPVDQISIADLSVVKTIVRSPYSAYVVKKGAEEYLYGTHEYDTQTCINDNTMEMAYLTINTNMDYTQNKEYLLVVGKWVGKERFIGDKFHAAYVQPIDASQIELAMYSTHPSCKNIFDNAPTEPAYNTKPDYIDIPFEENIDKAVSVTPIDPDNIKEEETEPETEIQKQPTYPAYENSDAGYGYVIEGSDTRYVDYYELLGMSKAELRLARNEIYARHGRIFASADLNDYFSSMEWYCPYIPGAEFDENSILNDFEKKNLELIKDMEAAVDYLENN